MKNLLLFALISLTLVSCKKESELRLIFNHEVAGSEVKMDELVHFNQVGQTYSISKLKYYISEISFVGENGAFSPVLSEAHLIDLSQESSLSFPISIDAGVYNKIEFRFGISKENNKEIYLENTLANQNMFWPAQMEAPEEKGAFHYMKLEGKYFESNADSLKSFLYHFGPTNGADNSFRVSIAIDELKTRKGSFDLGIAVDIQEWFQNPTSYDFRDYSNVMMNQATQEIYKANGQSVFSYDYIVEYD